MERWRPLSREAAQTAQRETGVSLDENLLLALVAVESGGEPKSDSAIGAVGLAHIQPATFADLRSRYPRLLGDGAIDEPRANLIAAAVYLAECAQDFDADLSDPSDLALTLHAYQLGPRATAEALRGGGWLPSQTVAHAARIMALYRAARTGTLPQESMMIR